MGKASKKKVTRKEVAERAQVSTAVVSYVVNNGPRAVSPETRKKVEEAIDALGYFPNEIARSLRARKTSTIGLIVPDITEPGCAEIVSLLERQLRDRDHLAILCVTESDPERELHFVELLRNKQVDGVVLVPSRESAAIVRPLSFAGIPTVVVGRRVPNTHCVVPDLLESGRIATEHLLTLGHRRIAILDTESQALEQPQKVLSYCQALAHYKIAYDEGLVIQVEDRASSVAEAVRTLLSDRAPPTAIIAGGDPSVLGIYRAAGELNVSVPHELSVVGVGTTQRAKDFYPAPTSVQWSRPDLSSHILEVLLRTMEEQDLISASDVEVPVSFLTRSSTQETHSHR